MLHVARAALATGDAEKTWDATDRAARLCERARAKCAPLVKDFTKIPVDG